MTPESRGDKKYTPPEWATPEQQRDLTWIEQNLELFWTAATSAFEESGRGAVVVDTDEWPREGSAPDHVMFTYFVQATIEQMEDEEVQRFVETYDPAHQFVIVLLKTAGRTAYKVPVQITEGEGDPPAS